MHDGSPERGGAASTLAQPECEFDFFIGHAAKDIRAAERLYSCLADRARVFLASKSLRLGQSWDVTLRDAQMKAAVTVILVSKATDEAFYQRDEIARAIAHARKQPSQHTVVPVFLDGIPGPDSPGPYGLGTLHGLSISRSFTIHHAADKLMDELSKAVRESQDPSQRTDGAEVGQQYAVDLCLCVDSGPEADAFMEGILSEALKFPYLLMGQISMQYQSIGRLRVRILTNGADVDLGAMRDSDTGFLDYPQHTARAAAQAHTLRTRQPAIRSRVLISLEKAIRSSWSKTPPHVLHVIAVWSASPLQVDKPALDRLKELWEDHESTGLSPTEKRLAIFAPESEAWNYIGNSFSNTIWRIGTPGSTKPDEFEQIMKALTMDVQPEERQDRHAGILSVYCINTALDFRELREQAHAGGQQRLTDHKRWVTGRQLLAEARRAGERMPILFSSPEEQGSLTYWAVIDDITIDDRTGTKCSYSELRAIEPVRQRSELRLRTSQRQLSDNFTRSHAICYTPGFLAQDPMPFS
jgi:hypothetical protein